MTAPAPPWTIAATVERVELDPTGRTETTFTVTNNGPVDQRLVFDVVRSDNAGQIRVSVPDPQRLVPHGGSVSFLVKLAVPTGAPAGSHWLAGRVYSADGAPEESSVLSDRVAVEVAPTAPTPRRNVWLWLIPAAVLVIVVIGDEPPSAAAPPVRASTPPPPKSSVHATGTIGVRVLATVEPIDFDEITKTDSGDTDVVFGEAVVEPRNGAEVGVARAASWAASPAALAQVCASTRLTTDRFPSDPSVGDVICVRTNTGRISAAVVTDKISIFAGRGTQLTLAVTTFVRPDEQ
jgi:hypothetical protein